MKKLILKKQKASYEWRAGNSFTLLKDGSSFLPRMIEAINSSSNYILFEMYFVQSGELTRLFVAALSRAARRGVSVYMLFDGYGSLNFNADERVSLKNSGVQLTYCNPLRYWKWRHNLHRDHRKLLLIDGRLAFTGGFGLSDEFSPDDKGRQFWRETVLEIKGPVIKDWHDSFRQQWAKWSRLPLEVKSPQYPSGQTKQGDKRGRVSISAHYKKDVIRSLINHIRISKERVWLTTAYFIPTWKIRRALRKAARSGTDVRLLLPGSITDHQSVRRIGHLYYKSLLRNGIRIYEYQPRFIHAKVLICDNWLSIGSNNLDRWSMRLNMEANQEIIDIELANDAAEIFIEDINESEEISYAAWNKRSWLENLLDWLYGRGMLSIEHFAHLKKFRLVSSSRAGLKAVLPNWLKKHF